MTFCSDLFLKKSNINTCQCNNLIILLIQIFNFIDLVHVHALYGLYGVAYMWLGLNI